MKLMRAMLCAVVLGAFSVPAAAAPANAKQPTKAKVEKTVKSNKAPKGKTGPASKKSTERIKKYDFLGDNLEGDIVSPDGDINVVKTDASFSSLIKFRTSFLPEITKAGEDL